MTTLGEKLREAIEKKSIESTLNEWDEHENQIRKPQPQEKQMANPNPVIHHDQDKPHFGVSNNVMRETFSLVKNAPGMKHKEYVALLKKQGFKESSSNSVLYQLTRVGQIKRNENGGLYTTQDAYTPIKSRAIRAQEEQAEPTPPPRKKIILVKRREPNEGIAALTPDTGGPGLPNVEKFDRVGLRPSYALQQAFIPSAIVDQLPVLHARELYDYLKKIFGGN